MSRFTVVSSPNGAQLLGPHGEKLWEAPTANDLVVLLVEELVQERRRRTETQAQLAIEAGRAATAIRVARDILKPLLLSSVSLIRELASQNGDRCMLGDRHAQRAKDILKSFDSITA